MWDLISNSVTSKYGRIASILTWLTVPVLLTIISPSLSDVSSNSQEDFLPVGAESTEALKIQQRYFPSSGTPGILVYRKFGGLTKDDISKIETDFNWLAERASNHSTLGELNSIFNNPGMEQTLMSNDKSTMMIFFSIMGDDEFSVDPIRQEIELIRDKLVDSRNDELEVWLTGPAGILEDAVSVFLSIDFRITITSIILVLIILLAIYRAPLLAILPIVSAGFAYLTASAIVALLAEQTGLIVNAQATAIMVVLIFGAGTDYMLFISSRFKELLKSGSGGRDAIANVMKRVGPAILSSAATTILAMLALGLATLKSFQILGPILALGMTLAILSGITLIPAVLSLLDKAAYWPSKIVVDLDATIEENDTAGFWKHVVLWVANRPLFTAISSVTVLLVMASGVLTMKPSYDLLASLPEETESVQGYVVMQQSFPAGSVSPSYVYVTLDGKVIENLDAIEKISASLAAVEGVSRVTSASRPFGSELKITISDYVSIIESLSETTRTAFSKTGISSVDEFVKSGDLTATQTQLAASIAMTYGMISGSENVTRIEVVFQNDPGSIDNLGKINDLRKAGSLSKTDPILDIIVGGNTAIQYDTKVANDTDIKLIAPIALFIIFAILIILVRALVAPLYLLGSVVLSFFGSLGISVLIFQKVLGHDGVGAGVPIYMFVFLVALGVDYNIYIISRVKEEAKIHGIEQGTIIAVSKTGGVITSAGIILAGTFAAMTTLPLRDLFQLGFVVAIGVLLDTFFVRGIMVPAFVILLGKFNWWPRKPDTDKSISNFQPTKI